MQDKGFILIAMLLIMLILAVTAVSLSRRSGLQMRMSGNRVESAQKNLGVIAAQEEGLWQLTRDPFWWQTDKSSQIFGYKDGNYTRNATRSSVPGFENDTIKVTAKPENSNTPHRIFYRYHIKDLLEVMKPTSICVGPQSIIYFTDPDRHSVYKVDTSATHPNATRIAGTGETGYSGDGGDATAAELDSPNGVAYDGSAKILYIADSGNHCIRKVDTQKTGNISTIAGTGTMDGYSGDGEDATNATMRNPHGIAYDGSDKVLYIADSGNHCIRKVDTKKTGNISTIAGNGTAGYSGDEEDATNATMRYPHGIAYDGSEKVLYIADSGNHCIRKVDTNGDISTIAGTGEIPGYSGDATNAKMRYPQGVTYDGCLYIADSGNHCIRKVDTNGDISTIAGKGTMAEDSGDEVTAANSKLDSPQGLCTSDSHELFIADTMNSCLRKIYPLTDGATISTLISVDDHGLNSPFHIAQKDAQELYIADSENHRIRKVNLDNGTVTTVAGNGTKGYSGDGENATMAGLNSPHSLAIEDSELYIADTNNSAIREIDLVTNIITTVAGNGTESSADYEGPATNARLNKPRGLAFDNSDLYIADTENNIIRMVDLQSTPPTISPVAGTGTAGYSGDGGPATNARLNKPRGLAFDNSDLYIADTHNSVIRKVDLATNIIKTVTGNGTAGYSGDKGPATSATLNHPVDVFVDDNGHLYIADQGNHCLRVVSDHNGNIYTLAGNNTPGYNGIGPAIRTKLDNPSGVSLAGQRGARRIYISDTDNNRIRVMLYKTVQELY